MPFILTVGTPEGLKEVLACDFPLTLSPNAHLAVGSPSFPFWLQHKVIDLFNQFAGEDMNVRDDAVLIDIQESRSLRADLAVVIVGNWSQERIRAHFAIRDELDRQIRANGFTGSLVVRINLVGSPTDLLVRSATSGGRASSFSRSRIEHHGID